MIFVIINTNNNNNNNNNNTNNNNNNTYNNDNNNTNNSNHNNNNNNNNDNNSNNCSTNQRGLMKYVLCVMLYYCIALFNVISGGTNSIDMDQLTRFLEQIVQVHTV